MKDYSKIELKTNENKEITAKELQELGYTRYDINQFLSSAILIRTQRGIYQYIVSTKEETPTANPAQEEPVTSKIPRPKQEQAGEDTQINTLLKEGFYQIIRKNLEEATAYFQKVLALEETNEKARFGMHGIRVLERDYEQAVSTLIDFYRVHKEGVLIKNIYAELLLLRNLTTIDASIIKEVERKATSYKPKKKNNLFQKTFMAIQEEEYAEALRNINFAIKLDKEAKKYHITNQIMRSLIIAVLKKIEAEKQVQEETTKTLSPALEVPQEEVVLIPEIKADELIKRNLLLEAINQNDYEKALQIIAQEEIENPALIIQALIGKLSAIRSLVNRKEPIKVEHVEEVVVVPSSSILKTVLELPSEEPTSATKDDEELQSTETPKGKPANEETAVDIESQLPPKNTPEEEPSHEEPPQKAYTAQERADIAYQAYKDALKERDFVEAEKNLRRYEYINNVSGTHRNIKYHYQRVEREAKEYARNPEEYERKKLLIEKIRELRAISAYKEARELIAEYKEIPGAIDPLLLIEEAEICFAEKKIDQAYSILQEITDCEEPSYYFLCVKIAFAFYEFQIALENCIAYNERKPNQNPTIYKLMGIAI